MTGYKDFTKGPIAGQLVFFCLPIALSLFLQAAYGAVDLMVVGRYGGAANVAAVSVGSQITQLVTFVVADLSIGATILIGRAIGEKNLAAVDAILGASLRLFGVFALAITFAMQPLVPPLCRLLRVPPEAFAGTVRYVRICCAGGVFIVSYNLISAFFRGLGNSVLPLVTVAIATACNIAGDIALIGGLGMAEAGAAVATVLSQGVSVLASLAIIRRQKYGFRIGKPEKGMIARILRLGSPIAVSDILVSSSFLWIAAIVNSLGVGPAASVGVAEKICGFLMLVPSAMSQAMSSFTAQMVGAGLPRRGRRALFDGILISFAAGTVMSFIARFWGVSLSSLFTTDLSVARGAGQYLDAYAIDCMLTPFLFCMIGYATGLGHTQAVLVQGLIGAFLVRIPVSWIMSREVPPSLFRIGLATPCSSVVQIVLCIAMILYWKKKEDSRGK